MFAKATVRCRHPRPRGSRPRGGAGRRAGARGRRHVARARLRPLPLQCRADLPEPASGQRALRGLPLGRWGGNSFLEPLPPGRQTWDEEQSFRNFERIQRLIVPGEPLESVLLVNPLAEEAGGSHWHAGGKHWESQDDAEWQALADWVDTTSLSLDFGFYRDEVEPIFLNRRPGNARCVVCHSAGGGNSFLEPLPPGRETWDEEQSFRNFERIQRLVVPGEPLESVLLVNPLVEEAGGSHWHAGGKHWTSQDTGRMADPGRVGAGAHESLTAQENAR